MLKKAPGRARPQGSRRWEDCHQGRGA